VAESIQSKADASEQALQVPSVSLADINPPEWAVNLIAQSPIASVISDPRLKDNPIIAVNQPFIQLTGYAEDEILGRNCRFLAGAGTEPWLTDLIREGVQDHRPVLVEILNYKKDGSAFRNAVLVAPIYDSDDELLYFLGTQVEVDEGNVGIFTARRSRAAQLVKTLSPRQLEVTKLVAQGLRNKEIAYELGLAEKTVKMHRGLVMEKLDLRTSADLIRIAVEAGI
jgi:PAS domain S-box-containing protein